MQHHEFTIPRLAKQLGVTPAAVRYWVKRRYFDTKKLQPDARSPEIRVFTGPDAERIIEWYTKRTAVGGKRGRRPKPRA